MCPGIGYVPDETIGGVMRLFDAGNHLLQESGHWWLVAWYKQLATSHYLPILAGKRP
jgi:hypothetical protein